MGFHVKHILLCVSHTISHSLQMWCISFLALYLMVFMAACGSVAQAAEQLSPCTTALSVHVGG